MNIVRPKRMVAAVIRGVGAETLDLFVGNIKKPPFGASLNAQ
jgi:hypothetical protein